MKHKMVLVIFLGFSFTVSLAVAEQNGRRRVAASRLVKLVGQQARNQLAPQQSTINPVPKKLVFESKSDRELAREVKDWRRFLAWLQQKKRCRFVSENSVRLDLVSKRLEQLSLSR